MDNYNTSASRSVGPLSPSLNIIRTYQCQTYVFQGAFPTYFPFVIFYAAAYVNYGPTVPTFYLFIFKLLKHTFEISL